MALLRCAGPACRTPDPADADGSGLMGTARRAVWGTDVGARRGLSGGTAVVRTGRWSADRVSPGGLALLLRARPGSGPRSAVALPRWGAVRCGGPPGCAWGMAGGPGVAWRPKPVPACAARVGPPGGRRIALRLGHGVARPGSWLQPGGSRVSRRGRPECRRVAPIRLRRPVRGSRCSGRSPGWCSRAGRLRLAERRVRCCTGRSAGRSRN